MREKVNIQLLPTTKYPAIAQSSIDVGTLYGWVDSAIRTPHKLVHMYFTTDERVTKDDVWVITDTQEVLNLQDFVSTTVRFRENCKKIVATTDRSLTVDLGHLCVDHLPQPTDMFIEEYCKNPTDEVMVTFEAKPKPDGWREGFLKYGIEHDEIQVKVNELNYIDISFIRENFTIEEVQGLVAKLEGIPIDSHGEPLSGIPEIWKNTIDMWCAPFK